MGTFRCGVRSNVHMKFIYPALISLMTLSATAQPADSDMIAGLTALKKANPTEAESAFDKVVSSEPGNAKAWYYRAVSRMVQGDHTGAMDDLDHLLILEPTDVHALLRRAEVNASTGDTNGAKSDLYKVIGMHANGPATEHALFELGRMAMEENDLPTALGHYDRLVGIASYNAMAWCDRGIVLQALGDDDRAIADLEKAVEMDPTLDQAYANLAIVLFRQGRRQEGCHALQQALDLGDHSVDELMLIHCDR